MMKANEVIRIGRSRSRAASSAASTVASPWISRSRANSTIRIAFLQARPTSTIRPIWVKMLLSPLREPHAGDGGQQHIGTIRMTASGRNRLSYLCRQHQEHQQHAQREDEQRRVAGEDLLIGQLGPLEAHALRQRLLQDLRDRRLRLAGASSRAPAPPLSSAVRKAL